MLTKGRVNRICLSNNARDPLARRLSCGHEPRRVTTSRTSEGGHPNASDR